MKNHKSKKLLAALSSAAVLISGIPFSAQAAETNYGDVNLDGKLTVADAVAVLQYLANKEKYALSEEALDNADVFNRGDSITGYDAIAIQKADAGIITLPESWMEGHGPEDNPGEDPGETYSVKINLEGTKITVEGDSKKYTSVEGSKLTITHSGEYHISGTLDDGQIDVNIADEEADAETVKLFLEGASITGKSAPAILVSNAKNTSITLADGTENTISDGDTVYIDAAGTPTGDAVIKAKDDLTIKGGDKSTGILNVTANTQDGIQCNNDIKINGGVINIKTSNKDDSTNGINGKTSLTVKSGTLTVDAEGDGIKSGKGSVAVTGGKISIKAGKDAVQAETTIDISGGELYAGGDKGLTAATGVNITGGIVVATATDNQTAADKLKVENQAAMLLSCVKDASNEDGCWKKANSLAYSTAGLTFMKKYSFVLISAPDLKSGETYKLTNTSTGAGVTHSAEKSDSFKLTGAVTSFESVDPAGSAAATTPAEPKADSVSNS